VHVAYKIMLCYCLHVIVTVVVVVVIKSLQL